MWEHFHRGVRGVGSREGLWGRWGGVRGGTLEAEEIVSVM